MGTWNKKKGTYTDSLTGTVSAPVGRKYHLSQMKRTEYGLKKVDDYYLDTGLEIMDVVKPSMTHEHKMHNHHVIENYFENNPPTWSILLPEINGYEWIIELTDGINNMIGFCDDEPPDPDDTIRADQLTSMDDDSGYPDSERDSDAPASSTNPVGYDN